MRAEVVVIGGGIAGASVAYYSLKKGYSVILIEKSKTPDGATVRSGGVVTRMQDYSEDIIYAIRALRLINEIIKDLSIVHKGFISIISNQYLEYDVSRYRKAIPDLKILYPEETRDKWDYIKIYEDEVVLYSPSDMTIEPDKFLKCLWDRIKDLGGEIVTGLEARKFLFEDKRVRGVYVKDDKIVYGDYFISCMGAWTRSFLRSNGIKIKTYLLSIPIFKFKVDRDKLIGVWDDEAYGYWRPHNEGYIIGGGYDGYIVRNPLDGFNIPHKESYDLVKDIFRFRYRFRYWKIIDAWTGTVSFTYSRRPLSLQHKNYSGLYIIDGLGGEGLVRGPGIAYEIVERFGNETGS